MYVPPRFIVVDDKKLHLQAIVDGFQRMGTSCVGIWFNPAEELERDLFRGVRGLFLDLHLLDGIPTTDHRRHFAQIASILEDNIHPSGGPFVLVIWTEHAHLRDELKEYLDANLDNDKPHAKPIAVFSLPKERYINAETGVTTAPAELKTAMRASLEENPQLLALLAWETDIVAAAGDTLASLVGLAPTEERLTATFPATLDTILSRLAREAVGRPNVALDHRAAIMNALAPILTDRVLNQEVEAEVVALWTRAVTRASDPALPNATALEGGKLNRMLHLAVPPERIRPTDWGAVVTFPPDQWTNDRILELLDIPQGELLSQEFKLARADRIRCRPCLIRVGGGCDFAQNKKGPLKYLLGMEIPLSVQRQLDSNGQLRIPASEWSSPVLVDAADEPFRLHVNVRFFLSCAASSCENWSVRYRIREQLLMHLISHDSLYSSRPGIVQLPILQ